MTTPELIQLHATLNHTAKRLGDVVKISAGERKAMLLLCLADLNDAMAALEDTVHKSAIDAPKGTLDGKPMKSATGNHSLPGEKTKEKREFERKL